MAGYYVSETSTTRRRRGKRLGVMVTSVTGYSAKRLIRPAMAVTARKDTYAWYKGYGGQYIVTGKQVNVLDATSPTVASTYPASNGTGLR